MSGTYVAAVALPITTATGEALFEFVDWSIYDQRTGQLVGKGSEGAYSGLVTRDVEVVALYNPIDAQVGDMPMPTVRSQREEGGGEARTTAVKLAVTWRGPGFDLNCDPSCDPRDLKCDLSCDLNCDAACVCCVCGISGCGCACGLWLRGCDVGAWALPQLGGACRRQGLERQVRPHRPGSHRRGKIGIEFAIVWDWV
jgi:hypothetical protein